MINSADRKADEKAEREAQEKAKRRAEQAAVIAGLQTALDSDEQLLAFARGRIAGGWQGKLNVGLEAFFAPYVNIGLTERRVILQHIHHETGKPSEILPHFFPIPDVASLTFTDIETFGNEKACRLILRLNNEQHFRLRLVGDDNFANARTLAEVFQSLTVARRRAATSPVQSVCPHCNHVLDQATKFCPYCGGRLPESETATASPAPEPAPDMTTTFAETPAEEVPDTAVDGETSSSVPPRPETEILVEESEEIYETRFAETPESDSSASATETDAEDRGPVGSGFYSPPPPAEEVSPASAAPEPPTPPVENSWSYTWPPRPQSAAEPSGDNAPQGDE